ncbi:maleylpyruvate isomerase [Kribbella voronezhensis]|uniref:Maleylpyruvate isomerase n=1 Tax=Kribbella voronezhensis TaxID=2512212 RepID=A0A4V3FKT8_9ACTN|nr:maleylpyruvate isomerase family mycothiol-dependent enzyme [Kribbella voronezhensis]TDU91533.1 maleylpyruvate isomerase [Kribbella voronezhensis]
MQPDLTAAVDRLNAVLEGVDEAAVRAPSRLPGWSRGHVLTHLANFSEAMTRQVEEALAGRLVEMYDGGRPARDAAIERGAGRPAGELKRHVRQASQGLLQAWQKVGPDDWDRPVRHRESTVAATVYTGWREYEIHTVDLGLEPTSDAWSTEFCLHLLEFLRPRTPDNLHLILRAPDLEWEAGTGETRVLTGALTDLTAWMAGREPQRPVSGDLPALDPWP